MIFAKKITIFSPSEPFWHGYHEESIISYFSRCSPTTFNQNPMNITPDDSAQSERNFEHPHVERIDLPAGTVYLVGTAHISRESVELARTVIEHIKPSSVAIELCESRLKAIQNPEGWKNMDVVQAIREGRGHLLLSQLLLAAFQKKIGAATDVRPGAEMLEAISVAKAMNAELILADRSIRTTLKRVWGHLGFLSAMKLISTIIAGLISGERVKPEDIERLKERDALSAALEEFGQVFPEVESTLIGERDRYMSEMIRRAPAFPTVAIVGAGHVPGISRILREGLSIDLSPLEEIPNKTGLGRMLRWIIPTLIIIIVFIGSFRSGKDAGTAMAFSWIIATGSTAAIGAILALAHPLTIFTATMVAPFTAVNPFLRSGWIAALIEAALRRPRVGDLEGVLDDMTTVRGWYRNRVCRVLLVLISVNLMGIIGGIVAVPLIARHL
jgi:pheromone shutdown-related protein TraB